MTNPTKIITLRDINMSNVLAVIRLKVVPGQERFVADNATSLAQAHFQPHTRFWAVYADETPVGFVQMIDDPENPIYYLWRFMISAEHQHKGYGRRALELLIAYVQARPNATALELSFVPEEGGPEAFYRSLGFIPTGAMDEGEVVARLDFKLASGKSE